MHTNTPCHEVCLSCAQDNAVNAECYRIEVAYSDNKFMDEQKLFGKVCTMTGNRQTRLESPACHVLDIGHSVTNQMHTNHMHMLACIPAQYVDHATQQTAVYQTQSIDQFTFLDHKANNQEM